MAKSLSGYTQRVAGIAGDYAQYRKAIGLRGAWSLHWYPGRTLAPPRQLRVAGLPHPIWFRPGTSDLFVFREIFLENEYRPLVDRLGTTPTTIFDLGANVGYSTRYFLQHFPRATVVAVEPDPHNFELLRRNTERFGERVVLVQEAVWSSEGTLTLSSPYEDKAEWARQLTLDGSGTDTVQVPCTTISSLLERFCPGRLDVLKVDIEGAEAEVFARSTSWIDRVDCVVTELHRGTSFGDAHAAYDELFRSFHRVRSGELYIGFRTATGQHVTP